ncbi:MAG: cytochrome c3 family protein [Nitrospirota bacterium]|nr:cytochrome c3 family protein [Nitrospirota bacterium]
MKLFTSKAGKKRASIMTARAILSILAAVALVIIAVGNGQAIDAPHHAGYSIQCLNCHQPHKALGSNLTRAELNPLVCQGCHNPLGLGKYFPMQNSNRAVPGVKGNTHYWMMSANAPQWGATPPTRTYSENHDTDMDTRLDKSDPSNPKVLCSTCHNQHDNSNRWGRTHLSQIEQLDGTGSTGKIHYSVVDHQAKPQTYHVFIVNSGSTGEATYVISDGSLDMAGYIRWFGWNGSGWIPFTGRNAKTDASSMPRQTGSSQHLMDGPNITITFDTSSDSFRTGDHFRFYVGYPFFRRAHDGGPNQEPGNRGQGSGFTTYFCRNCHSQRAQSHVDVETWTGTPRSHPVGQWLGSNGKGYDRHVPLDADGKTQSASYPNSPDGNWTNDLLLFKRGTAGDPKYPTVKATAFGTPEPGSDDNYDVQCMTCHAPHFTDSNSLTVDKR